MLTFATIPSILARGGAWHASLGTEQSRGTMALQLGGRVKQPGLVEVPFGLTLRGVLDQFGGGMAPGARFKAVQVGGPLGSLFPESQLDIPICYDAFAQAGAFWGMAVSSCTTMRQIWWIWRATSWPLRPMSLVGNARPAGLGPCGARNS